MSDYPEFNSVPKCKMCGYEPLYEGEKPFPMKYHPSEPERRFSMFPFKPTILSAKPEHIRRTCPRCGYAWHERTLEDE